VVLETEIANKNRMFLVVFISKTENYYVVNVNFGE
jgi:hypothetical protein